MQVRVVKVPRFIGAILGAIFGLFGREKRVSTGDEEEIAE